MSANSPITQRRAGSQRSLDPGLAVLLAVFALSRIAYYAVGVRFNAKPLFESWQILDPKLLTEDLMRSLWYLHMQPPGYNLIVGLALKFFPTAYGEALWVFHMLLGAGIAACLYRTMRWFDVGRWWACALTAIFMVSPPTIIYENSATYEYPVLFLVSFAVVALIGLCESDRPNGGMTWALTFFGSLFALEMIRNMFHVAYVVVVGVALLWLLPRARRGIAIGFGLAFALTFALYVKNWAIVGRFTATTWTGMQTGFITSHQLSPAAKEEMIASGQVSPLVKIRPFSALSEYLPYVPKRSPTGIPVLDTPTSSTGGDNFNDVTYLDVGDAYVKNSVAILRHRPAAYLQAMLSAWFSYFLPASDLPYTLSAPADQIRTWERAFSAAVFGQFFRTEERGDLVAMYRSGQGLRVPLYTGLFLVIGVVVTLVGTSLRLTCPQWRKAWPRDRRIVLGFLLFTVVFITAMSNLAACCETNRYRYQVDGCYLVMAATVFKRSRSAA